MTRRKMEIAPVSPVPPAVNVAVQDLFDKSVFSADFWRAFGYFQLRMYVAWLMIAMLVSAIVTLTSCKPKKKQS
jgi:hypothetical protein